MTPLASWSRATALDSADLILEPLNVEHAHEMAPLLDDEELHTFIGGEPATLDQLTQIYGLQVLGRSPDGRERWSTWVLRRRDTLEAAGYVQATITEEEGVIVAEASWVVAPAHQGRGLAGQAAAVMVEWLVSMGAGRIIAHVHPDHAASNAIAMAVGLHPTRVRINGDVRWSSQPART